MNQNSKTPFQSSDKMTDYLQNQRPTVIVNSNNEEIIIPPLNTDIRFNAYRSSGGTQEKSNQPKPFSHNADFNQTYGAGNGGKRKNN